MSSPNGSSHYAPRGDTVAMMNLFQVHSGILQHLLHGGSVSNGGSRVRIQRLDQDTDTTTW